MTDQGPDKRKGTPLYRQRVTCAECKGGNVQLNYFSNAVSLEGKWRTFAFLISRFQPPPFWALRNFFRARKSPPPRWLPLGC